MSLQQVRTTFFAVTLIPCLVATSFAAPLNSSAFVSSLPEPGRMVALSPAFAPPLIKGVTVDPDNPFRLDFIMDAGQEKLSSSQLQQQGQKLIQYFLASLAIPEKDLWVNLSPYEEGRTIPEALGQTDMGRDMLAQDYLLKQITASLVYPEKEIGKNFWERVYAQSQGNAVTIPVNTFNKVWITIDKAEIFERGQIAVVVNSHLKVMLEEDYLALKQHRGPQTSSSNKASAASATIRELVLPAIEHEINTGKNFAALRQIFHCLILATWYKNNLQQALLNQVYSDKSMVNGIRVDDPSFKDAIFQRYLNAYKKGVFNYIKDVPASSGPSVGPRRYFSGGIAPHVVLTKVGDLSAAQVSAVFPAERQVVRLQANFKSDPSANAAMTQKQINAMEKLVARHQTFIANLISSLKELSQRAREVDDLTEKVRPAIVNLVSSLEEVRKRVSSLPAVGEEGMFPGEKWNLPREDETTPNPPRKEFKVSLNVLLAENQWDEVRKELFVSVGMLKGRLSPIVYSFTNDLRMALGEARFEAMFREVRDLNTQFQVLFRDVRAFHMSFPKDSASEKLRGSYQIVNVLFRSTVATLDDARDILGNIANLDHHIQDAMAYRWPSLGSDRVNPLKIDPEILRSIDKDSLTVAKTMLLDDIRRGQLEVQNIRRDLAFKSRYFQYVGKPRSGDGPAIRLIVLLLMALNDISDELSVQVAVVQQIMVSKRQEKADFITLEPSMQNTLQAHFKLRSSYYESIKGLLRTMKPYIFSPGEQMITEITGLMQNPARPGQVMFAQLEFEIDSELEALNAYAQQVVYRRLPKSWTIPKLLSNERGGQLREQFLLIYSIAKRVAERGAKAITEREKAEHKENFDRIISNFNELSMPEERNGLEIIMALLREQSSAQVSSDPVAIGQSLAGSKGGIDLDGALEKTSVRQEGAGVQLRFDPAMLARIKAQGLASLQPEIVAITPIANILSVFEISP